MNTYEVKLKNVYEGPMDLLISLIKKDKIDIFDISIEKLTEDFLNSIENLDFEDADEYLDFVYFASVLLEIKSKLLLPKYEEDEEDPREELVSNILEYSYFKEISSILGEYFNDGKKNLQKKSEDFTVLSKKDIEYEGGDVDSLIRVFSTLLMKNSIKQRKVSISIPKDKYTVKKSSEIIIEKLKIKPILKFSEFLEEIGEKNEIISFFLASLELSKLNRIKLKQNELFDDIIIKRLYI